MGAAGAGGGGLLFGRGALFQTIGRAAGDVAGQRGRGAVVRYVCDPDSV